VHVVGHYDSLGVARRMFPRAAGVHRPSSVDRQSPSAITRLLSPIC
jgi:hypothetical protein